MNRLLPTWVLGELCHQWSCLPQLHDSLIPSQSQSLSWNARKVWEAVCSPGSLSLKCRNNLPTPPGPRPQNISHGFKSPSSCFTKFSALAKSLWSEQSVSSLLPNQPLLKNFLLSFLFLFFSPSLVISSRLLLPPIIQVLHCLKFPPSAPLYFPKFAFFHFHFFPSAAVLLPIHKFSLNLTQRTPFSFSFNVSSHLQMSEKWLSINCQKKLSVFSYFINVHQKGTDYLIWLPQSWFFASIFFFVTLVDKMDDNLDDKMVAALHLAWSPGCPR